MAFLPQYSHLENSVDRGAWRAMVHGVAKSRTGLSTAPTAFRTMSEHKHLWSELAIQVTWANFSLCLANFTSAWGIWITQSQLHFTHSSKQISTWQIFLFFLSFQKSPQMTKMIHRGFFSSEFWGRSNKQWGWYLELAKLWGSGSSLPNCQC